LDTQHYLKLHIIVYVDDYNKLMSGLWTIV